MKKITPLISVDAVEPCLGFWTGLGLTLVATVPHEDSIGFAMLVGDGVELMYQSRASIDADLGAANAATAGLGAELAASTTTLFIEVDSIDELLPRLVDAEVIVPRRTTFYGMDEVFVRAPCGSLVGFAAKVDMSAEPDA